MLCWGIVSLDDEKEKKAGREREKERESKSKMEKGRLSEKSECAWVFMLSLFSLLALRARVLERFDLNTS